MAAALAVLGTARVAGTYDVFSQTWDEPAHIAAGLEWLQRGSYTLEPLHPPLARVMAAAGPYLAGARLTRTDLWDAGNRVLGTGERY